MVNAWLRRNAVVVVLGAIAAGLVTWMFTRASAQPHDVSIARARLSACLLGEPVTHTDPGQAKLRTFELAGAPDWPQRCAPYATALEHALSRPDHEHDAAASTALAKGDPFDFSVASLLRADLDEPIASLAEAAHDVPRPPAPPPFARDVPGIIANADSPIELGDPDLALMFRDQLHCRLAAHAAGLEPVAHCSYVADAVANTPPWSPILAAGDLDALTDDGLYSLATGARLVAARSAARASSVAGTRFVWPADATRTSVIRRSPDGATNTLRLPHKLDASATLVRDQLLWTENERVVGVSLAGAAAGHVYEVAKAAHLPEAETCATDDVAGVLLVAGENEYRVAAFINGAWRVSDPGPRYRLLCAGGAVIGLSTGLEGGALAIDRVDCNATGCVATKGTVDHIPEPYAVGAIGSDTIVVWIGKLVHGVSGPLAQLSTAKPFLIYDGHNADHIFDEDVSKGRRPSELVQGIDVIGRGASAIVVLHGDTVKLVHVREGKAERVNVVFD